MKESYSNVLLVVFLFFFTLLFISFSIIDNDRLPVYDYKDMSNYKDDDFIKNNEHRKEHFSEDF